MIYFNCFFGNKRLKKLHSRSNILLHKEFDIIRLFLTIRNIKTYLKMNMVKWSKLKNVVNDHEAKRVINLETSSDNE